MSDRRSPLSDPPSSVEPEPTMVSVPVVGSSSMWNNGDDHHLDLLGREECSEDSYLHAGGLDGQDSTSCEDERMMVDDERSLTVNAIVAREGSVERESEGSEDHLAVVDNITAQNFLRESDLMNAASSALGHKKSGDHSDLEKSDDLHHNLLSSDPMEMESLLREQQDLDSGAYHLPHLSPSNSSTSSLDLPSVSSSGSMGLPPVSTIIRSSAKGRFDVFCRPSNINLIMGIPQYLSNSNSFDVMTSINSIQRHSPCDSLSAMEVPSSRHNDGAMDGGRCLKSSSAMSPLDGPDMMEDKDELGEMEDGFHHHHHLPARTTTVPSFVALREIMHISTSPVQQARLSPPTLEEMQKVAEISEHLQSGSPFGDDGGMLSPHFSSVGESNYVECLSQRPLVSAIETNVIMSTSNVDPSPKFTAADIKAIEQRLRSEQARSQDAGLEEGGLDSEVIIPDCIQTTQSSDIIYSDVQDVLSRDSEERKILKAHNIARSTIIEKNLLQQQPQVIKKESTVITSVENISLSKIITTKVSQNNNSDIITIRMAGKPTISESQHDSLPAVNPSAATASVIQQLLRVQSPPSTKLRTTMQRIPRGVITSTMSSKGDPIVHQDILVPSASPVNDLVGCKKDDIESGLSVPPNSILKETNLVDNGGSKDSKPVTIDISEHSVISHGSKSPTSSADEKEAALPNITTTVLPSLFSSLSASALASLQSSLSSALPNISICDNPAPPSPSLSSPPLSPILLPGGILRGVSSTGALLDSIVTSSSHAMYGGLLKMSGVVKQEPGGSGPLPPFTVVSGLSPLVKQHALLGASPVAGGGQQHVVTIKQEPGSSRASVSASEFNPSIILNAALPSIASIHLPSSAAAVQLPVVVTSSATSTAALTDPPVPSQASTIAFAATSSTPSSSSAGEEAGKDKKWSCLMCKNGSPCGLHPGGRGAGGPPQPALSGDPAKPFQCTLCGKHLASKNVYQLHLRSHSGEKPFTCSLCGHHFSQKTSLTRHMRSHTGERPFPCEVCGKRFADKERIKIHMRTHTGEKPFACEVCGKRFSQKSTVKRHMSVHTGEKPFKCESCGKGFANRGNLNAHSKTHANT